MPFRGVRSSWLTRDMNSLFRVELVALERIKRLALGYIGAQTHSPLVIGHGLKHELQRPRALSIRQIEREQKSGHLVWCARLGKQGPRGRAIRLCDALEPRVERPSGLGRIDPQVATGHLIELQGSCEQTDLQHADVCSCNGTLPAVVLALQFEIDCRRRSRLVQEDVQVQAAIDRTVHHGAGVELRPLSIRAPDSQGLLDRQRRLVFLCAQALKAPKVLGMHARCQWTGIVAQGGQADSAQADERGRCVRDRPPAIRRAAQTNHHARQLVEQGLHLQDRVAIVAPAQAPDGRLSQIGCRTGRLGAA